MAMQPQDGNWKQDLQLIIEKLNASATQLKAEGFSGTELILAAIEDLKILERNISKATTQEILSLLEMVTLYMETDVDAIYSGANDHD